MLKFGKNTLILLFINISSRNIEELLGQEIRAECFGEDEFLVVKELVNFSTAVDRCVELSGVLGVTFNQQEFDKVRQLGIDFVDDIYMGRPLKCS